MMFREWKSNTDHSFPFITGNGFATYCRRILNYGRFRLNRYGEPAWCFVKTDHIADFFKSHAPRQPFVLFTHNSDFPITAEHRGHLEDSRVIVWFAQNVSLRHRKLIPVPIGIANGGYPHGDITTLERVRARPLRKTHRFHSNFTVDTNPAERQLCIDCTGIMPAGAAGNGHYKSTFGYRQPLSYENYLEGLRRAYFCLAPRGNGIDSHRVWEALYLGAIPVVVRTPVYELHKKMNFPIVVLNSWTEFDAGYFSRPLYDRLWRNFDIRELYIDRYVRRLARIVEFRRSRSTAELTGAGSQVRAWHSGA